MAMFDCAHCGDRHHVNDFCATGPMSAEPVAPTPRETADHAELARLARSARENMTCEATTDRLCAGVEALLSEIAALRGERDEWRANYDRATRLHGSTCRDLTQAERQRDELRKAAETAANLFKLCTEPTMFENVSTLNLFAQMAEWLVRNRPLIANQGVE